jgi:hypothetical protein
MSAISELSTVHRVKAKTPEEKRLAAKEAGRDNKGGLSVPAARADRNRADHSGADARRVVPVVHQLQPDPGARVDGAG